MVAYIATTTRAASRTFASSAAVMTAMPATRWQLVPSTSALHASGLVGTGVFTGTSHVTPPAPVSIPVVNDDRAAKQARSPRGGQR
jgi:hypothetical protein